MRKTPCRPGDYLTESRHTSGPMKWQTRRQYRLFSAVILIAAVCAGGCSSNRVLVSERLDPVTSVTIRYSEHPLVFFRAVAGRSAFAKDYVDLAPVEINRSGDYRHYIWLGILTADRDGTDLDEFESIVIAADDTELQLAITSRTVEAIGASQPIYSKPFSAPVDAYYEVSIEQLRLLAEAAELRLHTAGDDRLVFEPWDSQERGKAALLEFVNWPAY